MARDYTKYTIEGLGENLNKRQLVYTIVKDWISKNKPSLEELQTVFPTEVQGSYGFFEKASEVKDVKRFNLEEPLILKNDIKIVVSNQWGTENIKRFIPVAEKLGYSILAITNKNSGLDEMDLTDQEEWNIDYVDDTFVFRTGCEGISGVHVGFKTNPFIPVTNYETIISYLNKLFFDDDAENLFTYLKEGDAIVLEACTYLLSFGEALKKYIEDYSEEELVIFMQENRLNSYLQSYILSFLADGTSPTVGELVQLLLIAPDQTVEVENIDTEFGNTSYELYT